MDQGIPPTSRGGRKAPPYVSYKTFKGLVGEWARTDVPGRIDASTMDSVPESVRGQMLAGLRFLNLIDGGGLPTDLLLDLAASFDTDQWPERLRSVLEASYPEVMESGIGDLPAEQLSDTFKVYNLSDDVRRKCYIFFVAAAQEAGVPLHPQVASGAAGTGDKTSGSRRRSPGSRSGDGSAMRHQQQTPAPVAPPTNLYRAAYEAVSAVWTPEQMSEDVDAAVVTLLRYLRSKETEPKA